MSRIDRLKEYANPQHGPHGAARDQENLDYWSQRASDNSELGHRAAGKVHTSPGSRDDDPPTVPNTNVAVRDTSKRPFKSRSTDAAMKEGRSDVNHYGSDYMKSIRRES